MVQHISLNNAHSTNMHNTAVNPLTLYDSGQEKTDPIPVN